MRGAFLLVLAWTASGCIAWAVPPIAVSGAMGSDERVAVSAGLYPLQALPELAARNFDFGVGYEFSASTEQKLQPAHAGYVEVLYLVPLVEQTDYLFRLGAGARGRFAYNEEDELGAGGALRVIAEAADFVGGSDVDCSLPQCHAVIARGEMAAGLFLEAGTFVRGGEVDNIFSAGLILRLPMSAGGIFSLLGVIQALAN